MFSSFCRSCFSRNELVILLRTMNVLKPEITDLTIPYADVLFLEKSNVAGALHHSAPFVEYAGAEGEPSPARPHNRHCSGPNLLRSRSDAQLPHSMGESPRHLKWRKRRPQPTQTLQITRFQALSRPTLCRLLTIPCLNYENHCQ